MPRKQERIMNPSTLLSLDMTQRPDPRFDSGPAPRRGDDAAIVHDAAFDDLDEPFADDGSLLRLVGAVATALVALAAAGSLLA
jgi:hypothetical protein